MQSNQIRRVRRRNESGRNEQQQQQKRQKKTKKQMTIERERERERVDERDLVANDLIGGATTQPADANCAWPFVIGCCPHLSSSPIWIKCVSAHLGLKVPVELKLGGSHGVCCCHDDMCV